MSPTFANDMIHHDVRSVPVLDHRGDLVGIVSRRDVVRSVIRTDEALAQEVQHRLDAYGGGVRRSGGSAYLSPPPRSMARSMTSPNGPWLGSWPEPCRASLPSA
jgi:hypothetical protein